jgi:predicted nucleic acid-binding protein
VVDEDGTPVALALRQRAKLIAPELLVAECANLLWKKVQRDELLKEEALLAARLFQGAEIELRPLRSLFETATRMSIDINRPAYDCVYLALAANSKCQFVTAGERFLRKASSGPTSNISWQSDFADRGRATLIEAAPECVHFDSR